MKLKSVISRLGTEAIVDENTRALYDYDNKKRKIMYTAQAVENGEYINTWITYIEDGTVNTLEERLTKFQNPLYAAYTEFVKYDRKKSDPDGRIYEEFLNEIREKEDLFFTEDGNYRNKFCVTIDLFGKKVVFNDIN